MARRRPPITDGSWRPVPGILGDGEALDYLSETYELPAGDALLTLFSNVRERATREQLHAKSQEDFLAKRVKARGALMQIQEQATEFQRASLKLRQAIQAFENSFEYEPVLMEEIASVGPATALFAAPELQCLAGIRRLLDPSGELRVQLNQLIRLQILATQRRARMPNISLQRCVTECRDYWQGQRRTWKTEALQDSLVRDENDPQSLSDDCERFVSDLLRAAGADCRLEELSAAMGKRRKGQSN